MTTLDLRPSLAASPWMLAASIALHGLLICAVILFSATVIKRPAPTKDEITPVKLVEPVAGPVVASKFEPAPSNPGEREPEARLAEPEEPVQPSEPERQIIQAKDASLKPSARIPLRKRKTSPQKVEEPPKKKPDKEKPPKKEDPKAFLEKRLADLRKKMENKKPDSQSSAANSDGSDSRPAGAMGTKPRGALVDEETARWFDGVRARVNSHWSAFGESRKLDKPTVIGVKLGDDGRLLDATVDESSGDLVFDRSAMRAVFQAAPFPPVTPGIREKIQSAGGLALRFTAGGMQ